MDYPTAHIFPNLKRTSCSTPEDNTSVSHHDIQTSPSRKRNEKTHVHMSSQRTKVEYFKA